MKINVVSLRQVNIEIKKSEYLAHVNGQMHKKNLSAMADGLQNGHSDCNTTGPILEAVNSAASLMMHSNGNGIHSSNHMTTEEVFHLPSPVPRSIRSSSPHAISRAHSTASSTRELDRPMSRLSLNGKWQSIRRIPKCYLFFYRFFFAPDRNRECFGPANEGSGQFGTE